ncbi:hypothetical protein BJ508DRAFT_379867 [Ascobolus immersus RN42]|uniref:Uncharacterized protein n=1 Tax=Ascobolus immersus RN42 TaxID=1160509 RepID=A0A3N4HPE4_ASCIM|nr:hypothetical protein BJ508DRAFT_379867 [Ascobolus immersus RN42]
MGFRKWIKSSVRGKDKDQGSSSKKADKKEKVKEDDKKEIEGKSGDNLVSQGGKGPPGKVEAGSKQELQHEGRIPAVEDAGDQGSQKPSDEADVKQELQHKELAEVIDDAPELDVELVVAPVEDERTKIRKKYWADAHALAKEELPEDEHRFLAAPADLEKYGLDAVVKEAQGAAGPPMTEKDRKMARFLLGLREYTAIVDTAIQHQPETISLVWAAVKLLLQLYTNDKQNSKHIQDALESIIRPLTLGEMYANSYMDSRGRALSMMKMNADESTPTRSLKWEQDIDFALPSLYAAVLVFCVKTQAHFEREERAGGRFKNAIKSFEASFLPYFSRIKDAEGFLRQLADQATRNRIAGFETSFVELRDSIDRMLEIIEGPVGLSDEEAKKWLRIGAVDPERHYEFNLSKQLEGTCEWFCFHRLWRKYLEGGTNLWVKGIPGAGKSVLAASLIRKLRKQHEEAGDLLLIYFFREVNPETVSPLAMIKSLIAQILRSGIDRRRILTILKEQMDKDSYFDSVGNDVKHGIQSNEMRESIQFDLGKMSVILAKILNGFPSQVYILLDALDECAHPDMVREHLLNRFISGKHEVSGETHKDARISKANNNDTIQEVDDITMIPRFLLTGRPNVSKLFQVLETFQTIKMKTEGDIHRYVSETVKKDQALSGFREEIVKTVFSKSEGMFRYAALLVQDLQVYEPTPILVRLGQMPEGINGMYEKILAKLDFNAHPRQRASRLEMRRRILWHILQTSGKYANELLLRNLTTIQYLCITDVENCRCEPDSTPLPPIDEILAICGPLICFRKRSIAVGGDVDIIEFEHRTVKEFLCCKIADLTSEGQKNEAVYTCLIDANCQDTSDRRKGTDYSQWFEEPPSWIPPILYDVYLAQVIYISTSTGRRNLKPFWNRLGGFEAYSFCCSGYAAAFYLLCNNWPCQSEFGNSSLFSRLLFEKNGEHLQTFLAVAFSVFEVAVFYENYDEYKSEEEKEHSESPYSYAKLLFHGANVSQAPSVWSLHAAKFFWTGYFCYYQRPGYPFQECYLDDTHDYYTVSIQPPNHYIRPEISLWISVFGHQATAASKCPISVDSNLWIYGSGKPPIHHTIFTSVQLFKNQEEPDRNDRALHTLQTLLELPQTDINAVDLHGRTALHLAVQLGRVDAVYTIVEFFGLLSAKGSCARMPITKQLDLNFVFAGYSALGLILDRLEGFMESLVDWGGFLFTDMKCSGAKGYGHGPSLCDRYKVYIEEQRGYDNTLVVTMEQWAGMRDKLIEHGAEDIRPEPQDRECRKVAAQLPKSEIRWLNDSSFDELNPGGDTAVTNESAWSCYKHSTHFAFWEMYKQSQPIWNARAAFEKDLEELSEAASRSIPSAFTDLTAKYPDDQLEMVWRTWPFNANTNHIVAVGENLDDVSISNTTLPIIRWGFIYTDPQMDSYRPQIYKPTPIGYLPTP